MRRKQKLKIIENYAKLFKIKVLAEVSLKRDVCTSAQSGLQNDNFFAMLQTLNNRVNELLELYECAIKKHGLYNNSFVLLKSELAEAVSDSRTATLKPIGLNEILYHQDHLDGFEGFIREL